MREVDDCTKYHGNPFRYCHCGWREESKMNLFVLVRHTDISGISGRGQVAEGVQFSDGSVVVKWIVGEHRSLVVWPNIESVIAVNGHDGATEVKWLTTN